MDNKKQSTEQYESTEENLVQDLKKSLEDTINETKYILDDLIKIKVYFQKLQPIKIN